MNRILIMTAAAALVMLTACVAEESRTETPVSESTVTTQQNEISPPAVTAEYNEEYEHIPIKEKPYQTPGISKIGKYFVHKKVGSALDMDIYLELLDKETDGLYCTVKNNKNVWREVVLSAYEEYSSTGISTYESFALAPNDEAVVKLCLNAPELNEINDLGFSFSCSGMNYSAEDQTADIRQKEQERSLSFVLWLYRFHEATLLDGTDNIKTDLSEEFIRGFDTNFFESSDE